MTFKNTDKEVLADDLGTILINSFNIKEQVDRIEITIEPQEFVNIRVTYRCSENMGNLCKTLVDKVKNYHLIENST